MIEVKDRLAHGQFKPWLQSEFEMTDRHARRFMQVAERSLANTEHVRYLPVSVLYELAAPSTPETIVEMVETGQIPATLPAIREAKQEVREREQSSIPIVGFGRTLMSLGNMD